MSCLILSVTFLLASTQWLWRLDYILYDQGIQNLSLPANSQVVLISVDENSTSRVGPLPWPAMIYAPVIDFLTHAQSTAVVLNRGIYQSGSAQEKQWNIDAKKNGKVLFSTDISSGTDYSPALSGILDEHWSRSYDLHHQDSDGMVRRFLLKQPSAAYDFISQQNLAIEAVRISTGHPPKLPNAEEIAFPFPAYAPFFRTYSYVDVLTGAVPASYFKDKIVIIGLHDHHLSTTYATPTPHTGYTSSDTELLALAIHTLERQQFIDQFPPHQQTLFSLLPVVVLLCILPFVSSFYALMWSIFLGALSLLGSVFMLSYYLIWWAPAASCIGLILAYPIWSWRRLDAAQRYLDEEIELAEQSPDLLLNHLSFEKTRCTQCVFSEALQRRIERLRNISALFRTQHQMISDTLESYPGAIIMVNTHRRVILLNKNGLELCQAKSVEAVRHQDIGTLLAHIRLQDRRKISRLLDDALQNHKSVQLHGAYQEKTFLLTAAPIYDSSTKNAIGTIINITDVTENQHAQRIRNDLLNFLSHDMRSPLASMITLLSNPTLLGNNTPEENYSTLHKYAERVLQLADNFLQIARVENLQTDQFDTIELSLILENAIDNMWVLAKKKQIHIDYQDPPEHLPPLFLKGRHELLVRAITNLLNNAIQYSPNDTIITVAVHQHQQYWLVSIQDQGLGIPEEMLPHLFERYQRFHNRKNKDGMGLGLTIVQTIIQKHEGKITVESKPEQGTRFLIYLPSYRLSSEEKANQATANHQAAANTARNSDSEQDS